MPTARPPRARLFAVLLLLTGTSSLSAQEASTYRAPAESVHWVSDNPFRLFLVRDGDTIPEPVRRVSVFRESWTPAPDGFKVVRASADVGFGTETRTDTMTVSPAGEVLRINGGTDYAQGEWDALLRLPPVPLQVGLEWSDTISHPTAGPHGPGVFEVRRSYRVERELSSPEGGRFEIRIEGEVDFALSLWTDSVAGRYRWLELSGPMQESYMFDPAGGGLHGRSWTMLLEGIGGDFDGVASDTVPAGLRSENRRFRIPDARAAALTAPLPGADTSITFTSDGVPLSIHTSGREPGRITEGFKRPDGMIGTADITLSGGQPARWTFTAAGLERNPSRTVYESSDGGLLTPDGRLEPPSAAWTVAADGMLGTLIPSLQVLGESQNIPFSIYRPTTREWDRASASSRDFESFSLFILAENSGAQTVLLVSADGVLLYGEMTSADGSRSVRIPAAQYRQAEMQRALELLQGGS